MYILPRIVISLVFVSLMHTSVGNKIELAKAATLVHTEKSMQNLKLSLQLHRIKTIKSSEDADELYMAVTVYPSRGRSTHREVPAFPRYWLSTHLSKIKNLSLWKGELHAGDSVTLQISLVERDVPPFNTDDLVATLVVKAKNDNGQLRTTWSMPNKDDKGKTIKKKNIEYKQFDLASEDANYTAWFAFIDDDSII